MPIPFSTTFGTLASYLEGHIIYKGYFRGEMSKKHILAKYYDWNAEALSAQSGLAGAAGHPGDTGANRENLIKDFISKHAPDRFTCYLGGKIVGLNQPVSKQIDCMVTIDIVPIFKENERSIAVVEAVAMALSVKSWLDKGALFNSLENLSSIPRMTENIIKQTSAIIRENEFKEMEKRIPSLYIFAYRGINPVTLLKHLNEYYDTNPSVPWNRRPRGILVNKEYAIKYSIEEMELENGSKVPPYTYHLSNIKRAPGYALAEIIVELSNIVSYYNDTWIQFYAYLNEAYSL